MVAHLDATLDEEALESFHSGIDERFEVCLVNCVDQHLLAQRQMIWQEEYNRIPQDVLIGAVIGHVGGKCERCCHQHVLQEVQYITRLFSLPDYNCWPTNHQGSAACSEDGQGQTAPVKMKRAVSIEVYL